MRETAERSEALIERLIREGDTAKNWRAFRAAIRMTQLIAYHQLGESGSEAAKDLRRQTREDTALLREMAHADVETAASVVGAVIQDALFMRDENGPSTAANRLDEALTFAKSTGQPFTDKGRRTPLADFVLVALLTKAEFHKEAGEPDLAIAAFERRIDVLADGLDHVSDPIPDRRRMAAAYFAIEAIAREQGDSVAAERAARLGQFADYGIVPWRGGAIEDLRKQAELALSNGEEVLRLEHSDVARTWFHGCAGIYARILEDPSATEADGYQMLRCMEKTERTYPDDPDSRMQVLRASRHETERLVARFPGLEPLGALTGGRMGELLAKQGDQDAAAIAFGRAGDRLTALLPEKDAKRHIVVAAGESYINQARSLQALARSDLAIQAYQSAASVYGDAHAADGGYGEQLTYILHTLASIGDRPADRWRRIIEIVRDERAPNSYMLDRRDKAIAKLSEAED